MPFAFKRLLMGMETKQSTRLILVRPCRAWCL